MECQPRGVWCKLAVISGQYLLLNMTVNFPSILSI